MFLERASALAASIPLLAYLILGLVALSVLLFLILRPPSKPNYKKPLKSGVPAQATVLDVGEPEVAEHGIQVLLLLEVNPTDKQPYKTVLECEVPPESVPHAGQSLAIEFDPRDPKRVILAREGNAWRSTSSV